jgi:hypothetical protein
MATDKAEVEEADAADKADEGADRADAADKADEGADEADAADKADEGADESDAADTADEGETLLTEVETPKWTPAQREYINQKFRKRLAPYVRRAKEAEEKLAEREEESSQTRTMLDADTRAALIQRGIPPEMVNANEAAVLKEVGELERARKWCRAHRRTGYEGAPNERSMTPEEVEEALDRLDDELEQKSPRAHAIRERVNDELMKRFRGDGRKVPTSARTALPVPPRVPERRGTSPVRPVVERANGKGRFELQVKEGQDEGEAMDEAVRRVLNEREN